MRGETARQLLIARRMVGAQVGLRARGERRTEGEEGDGGSKAKRERRMDGEEGEGEARRRGIGGLRAKRERRTLGVEGKKS